MEEYIKIPLDSKLIYILKTYPFNFSIEKNVVTLYTSGKLEEVEQAKQWLITNKIGNFKS
jgi:hypothetical protein